MPWGPSPPSWPVAAVVGGKVVGGVVVVSGGTVVAVSGGTVLGFSGGTVVEVSGGTVVVVSGVGTVESVGQSAAGNATDDAPAGAEVPLGGRRGRGGGRLPFDPVHHCRRVRQFDASVE